MPTDKNKAYKARWEKDNSLIFHIRLNKEKHDHIIRWLETVPNVSEYVRLLIEKDIDSTIK